MTGASDGIGKAYCEEVCPLILVSVTTVREVAVCESDISYEMLIGLGLTQSNTGG